MRKNLVRLEYYETYYYANIISNVITDPFPYIRSIHEWYEDDEEQVFLPAFPKFSRFHSFCHFVIDSLISEKITENEIEDFAKDTSLELWVDRALKYHGFSCNGFNAWLSEQNVPITEINEDHLYDYHEELRLVGELDDLIEHLANETFHVLFANRKFLAYFNAFMARLLQLHFETIPNDEFAQLLRKPGVLNRVNIPTWVKHAVFFRDRGMCSQCRVDLSGIVSAQPAPQYDHIIPLAIGGLNDVTNIQLLCQPCNSSKSSLGQPVSTIYESWY